MSGTAVPRISVVMPVYNASRYLGEAVESILAQTFRDFELIALDDGSTDRSKAILDRYAADDARIRVLSRPNTGIVGAMNDCLAVARGEFIARMDADDIALPERFATQVAYLDEHPECAAVGTQILLVDEDGDPYSRKQNPLTHEEIDGRHMEGGGGGGRICHPTLMARRAAIEAVGGYREEFRDAEDVDLYLRLVEHGGRLANLPEVLLHYRIHGNCVGSLRRANQLKILVKAVEEAHRRRGLSPPVDLMQKMPEAVRAGDHRTRIMTIANDNGFWRTARKYALRLLLVRPWSPHAWRLAMRMSFGWGADQK